MVSVIHFENLTLEQVQKFDILNKTQTQGNAKLKEKLKTHGEKSENSRRILKDSANLTPTILKITK